jgi:hypothetical protein
MPAVMEQVQAGMEERACCAGTFPSAGNTTSMVTFQHLKRLDQNDWVQGYADTSQRWQDWSNCATAYVDAPWSNGGHADFTDYGGPYPYGFTSNLEGSVTVGGNRPTRYQGQVSSVCGFNTW